MSLSHLHGGVYVSLSQLHDGVYVSLPTMSKTRVQLAVRWRANGSALNGSGEGFVNAIATLNVFALAVASVILM